MTCPPLRKKNPIILAGSLREPFVPSSGPRGLTAVLGEQISCQWRGKTSARLEKRTQVLGDWRVGVLGNARTHGSVALQVPQEQAVRA